jgi:hypothetical protein
MNWYQVLAVLLLLYLPVVPDLPAAEPVPGTDKVSPPAPPPDMPPGGRQEKPAPAERFTPSEKIGADSAVSFPVDI